MTAATLGSRYVLESYLARGGMGEVFRASSMGAGGFKKPVVIKRIRSSHEDREELLEMFVVEAKLMTRLAHPNIVQVLDFGRAEDGSYFLVLELVEGVDFGQLKEFHRSRGEPLPLGLALHIVAQTVRGLGFAHAQGAEQGGKLVHRDVSPGNVLLSRVGEVKVADFGVALVSSDKAAGSSAFVGKPSYMAPEQFSMAEVDGRADLFSAAVMMFEALTNQWPFEGSTHVERQAAATRGQIRSASALRRDLPASIDAFFARALAPAAKDRFPDARAMVVAVDQLARAEGAALASQDDVADAVGLVRSSSEHAPEVALAVDGRGAERSEPTRVERGGEGGAFTVSLSGAAREAEANGGLESRLGEAKAERFTERLEQPGGGTQGPVAVESRRGPPIASTARRALVVGGVLALAGAAGGFYYLRSDVDPGPVPGPWATTNSEQVHSAAQPAATRATSSEFEPTSSAATATALAATRSAAPNRLPAAADPTPTAALTSAPSCRGAVLLKAKHAWIVSGGPSVVEAPARVTWPCGTYTLSAKSRLDDGARRSQAVTVTDGGLAAFDLR